MRYCAAIDCKSKNSGGKTTLFKFPAEKEHRSKWLTVIGREVKALPVDVHLCHLHFEENQFQRDLKSEMLGLPSKRILKDDAVPTIFRHTKQLQKRKTSEEREERNSRKQLVDELLSAYEQQYGAQGPQKNSKKNTIKGDKVGSAGNGSAVKTNEKKSKTGADRIGKMTLSKGTKISSTNHQIDNLMSTVHDSDGTEIIVVTPSDPSVIAKPGDIIMVSPGDTSNEETENKNRNSSDLDEYEYFLSDLSDVEVDKDEGENEKDPDFNPTQNLNTSDKDSDLSNETDSSDEEFYEGENGVIKSCKKKFNCKTCHKVLCSKGQLRQHVGIHTVQGGTVLLNEETNKRKYQCNTCHKMYNSKYNLTQHIKVHGEREYKCTICDKLFYKNSHLLRHIQSHRSQKDFTCNECGKLFKRADALKVHQRIHTGDRR